MSETSAQICKRLQFNAGDVIRGYYGGTAGYDEYLITAIGRDNVLAVWQDPSGGSGFEAILDMSFQHWAPA